MQLFIAISLVLIFIVTLVGLLLITGKSYGNGTKLYVVLSKLLASIFANFLSGFIILFIILFITYGPEGRIGNQSVGERILTQTICLVLVGIYGLIGYLLCSFINGKLIESISEFNVFYEEPQSILPYDYHR